MWYVMFEKYIKNTHIIVITLIFDPSWDISCTNVINIMRKDMYVMNGLGKLKLEHLTQYITQGCITFAMP